MRAVRAALAACCVVVSLLAQAPAWASWPDEEKSPRLGITFGLGHAYDPEGADWYQVSGVAIWDYEDVWGHAAPPALHVKAELSLGVTDHGLDDAMASCGFAALYYLEGLQTTRMRPFVEAGIGGAYTTQRVHGQALHYNFNPQAGIGVEAALPSGDAITVSLRAHHRSNGGLHADNRGVNGVLLSIGWLF